MRAELKNTKIDLNIFLSSEHVLDIEIQICIIKERARSCCQNILLKYVPKIVLVYMLVSFPLRLNVFPPKGGFFTLASTHTIFTGVKFDYNKHW